MHYSGAVAGRGLYTDTIWPFHIIDLNCTGGERTIWECAHNSLFDEYSCSSRNDASLRCQGMEMHMMHNVCLHVYACISYQYSSASYLC